MVNPRKAYPIDAGLIPVFDRTGRSNVGHALETAVLIELERRRCEVTYVRTPQNHEVDFLARLDDGRLRTDPGLRRRLQRRHSGTRAAGTARGQHHLPGRRQAPAHPEPRRSPRPSARRHRGPARLRVDAHSDVRPSRAPRLRRLPSVGPEVQPHGVCQRRSASCAQGSENDREVVQWAGPVDQDCLLEADGGGPSRGPCPGRADSGRRGCRCCPAGGRGA